MKYLERSLEVATVNNDSELITRAKSLIDNVRINMGESEPDMSTYTQMKKRYELEAKKSESGVDTIQIGVAFAETLKNVHHRGVESERLFMKLREICQRVHGSEHKLTKLVHSKQSEKSSVRMRSEGNDNSYILFDYDGSFQKCMGMNQDINVISAILSESKRGGKFRVPIDSLSIDDVVFDNGTIVFSSPQPVGCNGDLDKFILGDMRRAQLVDEKMFKEYDQDVVDGRLKPAELNFKDLKLGDIRAWYKDTKCYMIHWEDESIAPCAVPRDRVFVPNCICSKCIESNKQFMFSPNEHFPKYCEWGQEEGKDK